MKLVFNFRNENGQIITSKSFSPIRVDEHGVRKNIMHYGNQILFDTARETFKSNVSLEVINDEGKTVETVKCGKRLGSWSILEAAMDTAPLFAIK